MSSLTCVRCKKGLVTQSLDNNWCCTNCKHIYKKELISCVVNEAEDIFSSIDHTDSRALEKVLDKFLHTFSPNHNILLDVKQMLVAIYREAGPTTKVLQKKIQLCKEILSVLMLIEPGISRLKGT